MYLVTDLTGSKMGRPRRSGERHGRLGGVQRAFRKTE